MVTELGMERAVRGGSGLTYATVRARVAQVSFGHLVAKLDSNFGGQALPD